LADGAQPFGRAPGEDVAAQHVAAHQLFGGLAHGFQPLQPPAQPLGEVIRVRVGRFLARKQQGGFQIGEPGRHHEIVGSNLQPQGPCLRDKGEILFDERQDRDGGQVDLLVPRQRQQQVERALPAFEADDQGLRRLCRRGGLR
jgi:hypothetical protein